MAEKEDLTIASSGKTRLATTVWRAKRPKAVVVWLHGYAEHRQRYEEFANFLASKQMNSVIVDLRGHGESTGKRGHIDSFQEYLDDLEAALDYAARTFGTLPIVLGAHSNGGLIATRYLQESVSTYPIRCLVMTGPFFDVSLPVPPWKIKLANFISGILPGFSMPTGIESENLTHDPELVQVHSNDPLIVANATARWYVETVRNQQLAIARALNLKLPTLIMQAGDDRIVSGAASRTFFDALGTAKRKKKYIEYPGLYHEILNETNRSRVYKDLWGWMKKYYGKR